MTVGNDSLLTSIQPRWPAELLTHALGPGNAFVAPLPDQLTFELSQTAHDRQDQLTLRRRGIAPRIIERLELGAAGLDRKRFSAPTLSGVS
jgi:hypothetical protein